MAHALTLDAGIARPRGLLAGLRRALVERRLVRRTRDELAALSDRDLADLGIRRGDIGRVAREAVFGA